MGWKPKQPLKVKVSTLWSGSQPARIDVQEHRGVPGRRTAASPDLGAHLGHALGNRRPRRLRDLVEGPKHRGVRRHRPEQVALETQVLDVSTALPATPASITHDCTRTLPRSCNGARSPVRGMWADSASPRPNRSAKDPRACSPTWATTPAPPGSTTTRHVLVPFTLEVPFWKRNLLIRDLQFPLLGGHIRGRGPVSSWGSVNSWG
jgi:hypothetical protein